MQHIEKVMQHKDLEIQLLEAKLQQATVQLAEEKERNLQEKQQVLSRTEHGTKLIIDLYFIIYSLFFYKIFAEAWEQPWLGGLGMGLSPSS